jgi:hypothetical protein
LFWTVRIPSDAVEIHLGKGSATFEGEHQDVRDFFSIPNSLNNGSSDPATVSYRVEWRNVKQRRHVNNPDLHVAGLFLDTDATIHWTGRNQATGFTFSSNAEGQQAISAQVGHERNGVFFS